MQYGTLKDLYKVNKCPSVIIWQSYNNFDLIKPS